MTDNDNYEKMIEMLNKHFCDDYNWFVCDRCNKLTVNNTPHYLGTSKWGDDRPFCLDCIIFCKECEVYYSLNMSYRHEDCNS